LTAAVADVVQALASASIRLTTLPVSRGFTAVRTGSRLRFLVQQRAECVFVAVFKFSRFDRLHGRDARSKPKFSVAVAVAAVVVAAVAAVAVAAVAAATVAVVAAAVVAVIVTVIGRVAVGPVKGAGA
jgi:fatty acid desaturase